MLPVFMDCVHTMEWVCPPHFVWRHNRDWCRADRVYRAYKRKLIRHEACHFPTLISKWPSVDLLELNTIFHTEQLVARKTFPSIPIHPWCTPVFRHGNNSAITSNILQNFKIACGMVDTYTRALYHKCWGVCFLDHSEALDTTCSTAVTIILD